jgi:sugar O-acyltransferase (sialic acid O-acetyltransferase NeuD family)
LGVFSLVCDSKRPLILFGGGTLTTLTAHCLTNDAGRIVAALTLDRTYMKTDTYEGYPVVAFDTVAKEFPPDAYDMILPIGYTRMNAVRQDRFKQAKAMGYRVASYVSSRASIWPDTPIGDNALIFEQAVIQSFARIGDNVFVRSGANIGHHTRVGDHSFIASGVVTGGNVTIGERCWIGLGAVLRNGITIGDRCFIGMGAVVTADTEPDGVYVGVPARRLADKTSLDVT